MLDSQILLLRINSEKMTPIPSLITVFIQKSAIYGSPFAYDSFEPPRRKQKSIKRITHYILSKGNALIGVSDILRYFRPNDGDYVQKQ